MYVLKHMASGQAFFIAAVLLVLQPGPSQQKQVCPGSTVIVAHPAD
jgi:hypothetical protein